MKLSKLVGPEGQKKTKRVGRGESSGWGKTSGRGHKGQLARAGGKIRPGFEGGQMPLQRRLPKKGFHNKFKTYFNIINLDDLARFEAGTVVTAELLRESGMLKRQGPVKLLSDGDISAAYTIRLNAISTKARSKVEDAGGKVEIA